MSRAGSTATVALANRAGCQRADPAYPRVSRRMHDLSEDGMGARLGVTEDPHAAAAFSAGHGDGPRCYLVVCHR
jgi:hypothetical protein